MTSFLQMAAWCAVAVAAVLLLTPSNAMRVDAAQVVSSDGFTMLTAQSRDPRASGGRELLYLIDHRSGMLLVYGVDRDESGVHPRLLDGGSMSVLFSHPKLPDGS
jgi:hypothetical protein